MCSDHVATQNSQAAESTTGKKYNIHNDAKILKIKKVSNAKCSISFCFGVRITQNLLLALKYYAIGNMIRKARHIENTQTITNVS